VLDYPLQSFVAIATADRLMTSGHYERRLSQREMPDLNQIKYLLCQDQPMIIEEEFHRDSLTHLVWGIMGTGRVGHILLSEPPESIVITAYWPDSEAHKWRDLDYIERVIL